MWDLWQAIGGQCGTYCGGYGVSVGRIAGYTGLVCMLTLSDSDSDINYGLSEGGG